MGTINISKALIVTSYFIFLHLHGAFRNNLNILESVKIFNFIEIINNIWFIKMDAKFELIFKEIIPF